MKTRLQKNRPMIITAVWFISAIIAHYKGIAIYEFIILSCYAGILYGILWGIQAFTENNARESTPEIIILQDTTWHKAIVEDNTSRLQLTDTIIDAEYTWSNN